MESVSKNNSIEYKEIYESILAKYGLSDNCIWIILGLELVGINNSEFWLRFVDNLRQTEKMIDVLQFCVTQMQKIPSENLLYFLNNLNNRMLFKTEKEAYYSFINLLSDVSKDDSFLK